MTTSMHTSIIGPVIETNHRLSGARAPSYANPNSILPRLKIGAEGINLWSIPNISPIIRRALVGPLYISMEDKNNLLDIALHHQEWQNWPQHRATKTNLIWLFNFTVTDLAVMRWLPSLLVKNLNAIYNVKQGSVKMSCHAQCKSQVFILPWSRFFKLKHIKTISSEQETMHLCSIIWISSGYFK